MHLVLKQINFGSLEIILGTLTRNLYSKGCVQQDQCYILVSILLIRCLDIYFAMGNYIIFRFIVSSTSLARVWSRLNLI